MHVEERGWLLKATFLQPNSPKIFSIQSYLTEIKFKMAAIATILDDHLYHPCTTIAQTLPCPLFKIFLTAYLVHLHIFYAFPELH
jgi:hypothetical protein